MELTIISKDGVAMLSENSTEKLLDTLIDTVEKDRVNTTQLITAEKIAKLRQNLKNLMAPDAEAMLFNLLEKSIDTYMVLVEGEPGRDEATQKHYFTIVDLLNKGSITNPTGTYYALAHKIEKTLNNQ